MTGAMGTRASPRLMRWLTFAAGRRSKWIVLAAGLVVLFVAGPFAGKFEDVQNNEPVSYLPGKAESVKVLQALDGFPRGQDAHRHHGLRPPVRAHRRRSCARPA